MLPLSWPDVRLLAVAGPPVVPPQRIVDAARAAQAGGVTAMQLRWKDAPSGDLLRIAQALVDALTIPVYVNDRADVAWLARAHGVHVGADDLPSKHIRAFAPRPFRIGVSAGTPHEAEALRDADVDYWSIGAVFATATKADAGTPIGVAGYRALAARAPAGMPAIAIGGIDASNAAEVLAAGAKGIAVSSAIFAADDVTAAARALRGIVDRAEEERA